MKKLFLLTTSLGIIASTMNAQQATIKSFVFDGNSHTVKAPLEPSKKLVMPERKTSVANAANKSTANPRWYSYFDDVDVLNGSNLQNNLSVLRMWFDSTILQTYTSGEAPVNFSSACMYIDPSRFAIYNDIGLHLGEMQITTADAYIVDSVRIAGVYEQNMDRPSTVVDTLIISVAPSGSRYSILRTNPNVDVTPYLSPSQDTLFAYTPGNVDSVNRGVFSDITSVNRIMWKEPLTAAMRDSGFNIKSWTFKVPGGLNVPAGASFSIAVTFKSGDKWVPNSSNIDSFHRYMPLTGSVGQGQKMPYYYYNYNDRNHANLMFSTDTGRYLPTILIEAINSAIDFRNEYLPFDAFILCPTCNTVSSVGDIDAVTVGNVYPNPATETITIPFTAVAATDVKVIITNAVGAMIAAQDLGRMHANQGGKVTFSVADYANGVYFYTIDASGQRVTKRFVVAH